MAGFNVRYDLDDLLVAAGRGVVVDETVVRGVDGGEHSVGGVDGGSSGRGAGTGVGTGVADTREVTGVHNDGAGDNGGNDTSVNSGNSEHSVDGGHDGVNKNNGRVHKNTGAGDSVVGDHDDTGGDTPRVVLTPETIRDVIRIYEKLNMVNPNAVKITAVLLGGSPETHDGGVREDIIVLLLTATPQQAATAANLHMLLTTTDRVERVFTLLDKTPRQLHTINTTFTNLAALYNDGGAEVGVGEPSVDWVNTDTKTLAKTVENTIEDTVNTITTDIISGANPDIITLLKYAGGASPVDIT